MLDPYKPFEIKVPHLIEEGEIRENCSGLEEEYEDAPYDEDA